MRNPVLVFFCLVFLFAVQMGAQPYFRVGFAQYDDCPRFGRHRGTPTEAFGTFGNGYGAHLSMRFGKMGKGYPFLAHTAVVFFPRHTITDATGTFERSRVMVPLEAGGMIKLFTIFKYAIFGVTVQGGPHFISTLSYPPGGLAPGKSTRVLLGGSIGFYTGITLPKKVATFTGGAKACRIGKNNFWLLELDLPLQFDLK